MMHARIAERERSLQIWLPPATYQNYSPTAPWGWKMAEAEVLKTLRSERDRLKSELNETQTKLERVEAAITAYGGVRRRRRSGGSRKRSPRRRGGRKKGSTQSAATKRKISQAMKKRWAERKKSE